MFEQQLRQKLDVAHSSLHDTAHEQDDNAAGDAPDGDRVAGDLG